MTLSAALSNAMTGLNATSRQADTVANNVANALTEGYGRREISLSPLQLGDEGAGVRVVGITRASDPLITAPRRVAQAAVGRDAALAEAQSRLSQSVGEPGQPGALATLADRFDAALTAAADTPESATLLSSTALAASDYARGFNTVSNQINALRTDADASIARQVDQINAALQDVERLNDEIRNNSFSGADIAALQDQRHRLIDRISDSVPVRVIQRENNTVALFATNGAQLLDGRAYTLEFTPTPIVTQDMTLAGGPLSGISINGQPIPVGQGDGGGLLDGGALEAQFILRDTTLPEAAAQLDAVARDLVERVQGLPADPTLGVGDAGLFTDGGIAFDPLNQEGLAGRLSVNPLVDPALGGDPNLLRDGINAVAPGDQGDDTVLRGLQDALTAPAAIISAPGLTGQRGNAAFTAQFSGFMLSASVEADARASLQVGRLQTLSDAEANAVGVDTDRELSDLLVIEQAFAANARVIQVVDELLERLLLI
ncbi:MAG: flagellar hook-associated protein FlgK [Pseudomonadota bacterium]